LSEEGGKGGKSFTSRVLREEDRGRRTCGWRDALCRITTGVRAGMTGDIFDFSRVFERGGAMMPRERGDFPSRGRDRIK
jgi:hypothetical protein